jgi:hypothetical protein
MVDNSNVIAPWTDFTSFDNINDVATGVDGSVWYITGTPGELGGTFRYPQDPHLSTQLRGGKRLAVDPSGNPWIVGFDGHIWRLTNGAFALMPGLARDIGIGANGAVWVIGTNMRNGSFGVWSWNGSTWIADPGSGEEIDVTANGQPVLNGSDGKIWIKDGGANQGWTQFAAAASPDLRVSDIGLSPCSRSFTADPGGSEMWVIDKAGDGNTVWTWRNSWLGPSFASSPNNTGATQIPASHIAVDTGGHVWAVSNPQKCDCPGDLLERTGN